MGRHCDVIWWIDFYVLKYFDWDVWSNLWRAARAIFEIVLPESRNILAQVSIQLLFSRGPPPTFWTWKWTQWVWEKNQSRERDSTRQSDTVCVQACFHRFDCVDHLQKNSADRGELFGSNQSQCLPVLKCPLDPSLKKKSWGGQNEPEFLLVAAATGVMNHLAELKRSLKSLRVSYHLQDIVTQEVSLDLALSHLYLNWLWLFFSSNLPVDLIFIVRTLVPKAFRSGWGGLSSL